MRSLLVSMLVLAAAPALAADECRIDSGPGDVVKKTADIVIEAGQVAEDVITLDGNVTIKSGANVKSAVSFHGNVIVEDGAKGQKSALAVGGTVKVARGASVNSPSEVRDDGEKVERKLLTFVEDGKDLTESKRAELEAPPKKSAGVKSPFHPDQRAKYQFAVLAPPADKPALMRIGFQPSGDKSEELYIG